MDNHASGCVFDEGESHIIGPTRRLCGGLGASARARGLHGGGVVCVTISAAGRLGFLTTARAVARCPSG